MASNETVKRELQIELKLYPSSANARVVDTLATQVGKALNGGASGGDKLFLGLANSLAKQLPVINKANAQIAVSHEKLAADLARIRAKDEADANAVNRRKEAAAQQSAQRQANAAKRQTPQASASAAANDEIKLAQARARTLAVSKDFVAAEQTLLLALAKTQTQTVQTANAETQLARVRQQAAQDQLRNDRQAQAEQRRSEADAVKLTQARVRLQLSSKDFAAAEKTLQDALAGTSKGTQQAIQLEQQLIAVRERAARAASNTRTAPTLLGRLQSGNVREAGESVQQAGQAYSQFITQPLTNIARASRESALGIDVFRSRLTALEGSADKANIKLEQLRKLALGSPGVTFQTAADQYALLKATTDLLPPSIEKTIQSIGKLNAAFKLDDSALFIRNLQQIFTQDFEVKDIREATGRVPIFNQLLKKAFGSDDPAELRKLKQAGKITAESFFAGLNEAINTDPRIANIQENNASRIEKLKGRATAALEPLGASILNVVIPVFNRLVPLIEQVGYGFGALPKPIQLTVLAIGGLTAAAGPALQLIGGFVQAFQLFQFTKIISDITAITGAMKTAAVAAEVTTVATASMNAQLAAAGTQIGKNAASGIGLLGRLNPLLLAVGTVVGLLALSTTTYAATLDDANKITTEQVAKTIEQDRALRGQITSLKEVTKAGGDNLKVAEKLKEAIAVLDPATRNYSSGLKTLEEKSNVVTASLERQRKANEDLLNAQRRVLVQGAQEAIGKLSALANELDKLGAAQRKYQADLDAGKNGDRLSFDAADALTNAYASNEAALDRASKKYIETNEQVVEFSTNLNKLLPNLIDATVATGGNAESLLKQLKAGQSSTLVIEALDNAFKPYIQKQNDAKNAAQGHTQSLLNQADATRSLQDAFNALNVQQNPFLTKIAVQAAKEKKDAAVLLRQALKDPNNAQDKLKLDEGKAVRTATEQLTKALNPSTGGGKSAATSLVESTTKAVARLKVEVGALEKGGGFLFEQELERERLTNVQSQLKEILKLRRQLGENTRVDPPKTEQAREAELRLLSREKSTREEIVRLGEAQADAEAQLRIARARDASPLVSQETRLELAMIETSIDRRNAEAKALDSVTLAQRRLLDVLGNAPQIRNTARADFTGQAEGRYASEAERALRLEAVRGLLLDGNLQKTLDATDAQQASNDLLQEEIDLILEIGRLNAKLKAGLPDQSLVNGKVRTQDTIDRARQEQIVIAQNLVLEERLAALRNGSDKEKASANLTAEQSRLQAALQTSQQLAVLRQQETDGYVKSAEFIKTAYEKAELSRRSAAQSTAEEIIRLQDEIANASEGSADRMQAAYLRAIRNIQTEDEAANVRLLENQIKLSRQTEIRYGRLNDRISDLLASQKGLTETFADFRANIAQDAFSGLDKAVDAITKKFGVMGDAVKQLLKDLLRLAATEIFKKLFNVGGQGSSGGAGGGISFGGFSPSSASSGGGGFNIPGIGNIGGNGGGIFTPGFNGGGGGADILRGGGGSSSGGLNIGGFNLGGLKGIVSKIPGINRIFGLGGVKGALPLSSINPSQLGGLSADTALGRAAGISQSSLSGVGAAAPSALASLGGAGLLAGGGLLGSLLGGKSPTGKLLGGLGGTLGAGFLGASGIFGSGLAAALPALLSNPVTAIIAGGLLATALVLNIRSKRELGEYKKLIQSEYAVTVKDNKILSQIKELGKQRFGKQYKDRRLETVQLEESKNVVLAYAEANGIKGNNKLRSASLVNPYAEENILTSGITRRLNGGIVPGPTLGRDHVPVLADGGEYVFDSATVKRIGLHWLRKLHKSGVTFKDLSVRRLVGGYVPTVQEYQSAGSYVRNNSSTPQFQVSNAPDNANHAMNAAILEALTMFMAKYNTVTPGVLFGSGVAENPEALANGFSRLQRTDSVFNRNVARDGGFS